MNYNSDISAVVLHYSATYPDQDITAADIHKIHLARGWDGIGYHYFVRRDGTVEAGRPEYWQGAHAAGQNSGKIGVCWAGGIDRETGPNVGVDNRTPEQNRVLVGLISNLLQRYPDAEVVGHKDLAATQCPGFNVTEWWEEVNSL